MENHYIAPGSFRFNKLLERFNLLFDSYVCNVQFDRSLIRDASWRFKTPQLLLWATNSISHQKYQNIGFGMKPWQSTYLLNSPTFLRHSVLMEWLPLNWELYSRILKAYSFRNIIQYFEIKFLTKLYIQDGMVLCYFLYHLIFICS